MNVVTQRSKFVLEQACGQGGRISTFQGRRRNAVPPLEFVFNFREGAGWQSENYTQIPMEFRGFLNSPRPAADTLVGGTVVETLPGLLQCGINRHMPNVGPCTKVSSRQTHNIHAAQRRP